MELVAADPVVMSSVLELGLGRGCRGCEYVGEGGGERSWGRGVWIVWLGSVARGCWYQCLDAGMMQKFYIDGRNYFEFSRRV